MPTMSMRDARRAPLREVTGARLREGRGGLLGPDTTRRVRWWDLTLTCGHRVERWARYRPADRPGLTQRDEADVLPSPHRARCETCTRD